MIDSTPTSDAQMHGGQLSAAAPGELPNRLLTAFEVAESIGCHEETVCRAYLRSLLNCTRFRAAINWGMAQTPPLFTRSPFHRFGVRMNKKAETVRDRRSGNDALSRPLPSLATACRRVR